MALRAGEPRGPVGIETLTQSPELLTNAKAAAQNDRHLSFFWPLFLLGAVQEIRNDIQGDSHPILYRYVILTSK